jgi:FtsZ-binding cell division protein ZapB
MSDGYTSRLEDEVADWEDWSNRLAENITDRYDGDDSQESIIEKYLADLRDEVEQLTEERDGAREQRDDLCELVDHLKAECDVAQERLRALTAGVEELLDSGRFDNHVVVAFGRIVHASRSDDERRCVTRGGSPWPAAESRCAAGDPWDDGLQCAEWVGTRRRPDCTCGGISACIACQSVDGSRSLPNLSRKDQS